MAELTEQQTEALAVVKAAPNIRTTALARQLGWDKGRATNALLRLNAKGLVRRDGKGWVAA